MKTKIMFAAIGSLLCVVALSLGGCSKEKPVLPQDPDGNILSYPIFVHVDNKASSLGKISLHFGDPIRGTYQFFNSWEFRAYLGGGGDIGWTNMDNGFKQDISETQFYDLEANQPNFKFKGSSYLGFGVCLVFSLNGEPQCWVRTVMFDKFEADPHNYLHGIGVEVTKAEMGKDRYGNKCIFLNVTVGPYV